VYLWVNVGRDRRGAGVAADGQHHLHRVRGSGQIRALCPRVERVAERARRRDPRPQLHAADDPVEAEKPVLMVMLMLVLALVLVLFEGPCRDGGGKGADLDCDRRCARLAASEAGAGRGHDRRRC
jgi:hypothetical protein